MNVILKWFYVAMVWLTAFELRIAEASSTNFRYIGNLKEQLRTWQRNQRLFELRSGK